MLQPKKPLDLSEANQILQSERKPLDLSSAEAILKKKESTESTSTIQESNGDSVQTIGSSGTVGSNGFPAIDVNLGVPGLKPDFKTVDQLANPPKSKSTIQAEQNNALKYEKFKQFSTLPDEIKKENAQKVEDEVNGIGFLNNVATFGKEAYNTVIEGMSNTPVLAGLKQLKVNTEPLADEKKEAKDLMIRQGVKPKDINSNTILELAKKIKLQKLNDSDIESRKKDFLSNTEVDFEDLQKGAKVELSKISNKDKELLKQKAMLEPVLRDSDNRLTELNKQLANFKKNNQQPTPEFVDEYNYAIKYHNDILKDVQKTDNQFADNRDKIGDLKTNLDLFKRQYGKVNNFVSNIGATALDLAAGGFGIVDYGFNAAYGALGIDTGPKENSEIVTGLRNASQKIRDRIAKPINVDNIEDIGDFGDWMANTVIANQIPIYGLIATGTGGIVALGGSSLGTKYGDMVQEMNPDNPVEGQILKNYSDAELAWKPVGFGIAETASALVDAHIMKGAARVLASATQPERRLISQTIAKRLLNVGKETIKGGATEAVDEMATQGVENIIDGKPFTEGMKDAGGAGAAMGALIPFFAGNIAVATKSFSIDNKIQNSAKKTIALEKELANPNLSEDAKKIIKTNFEESKKTTENLLKKKVKDISKMSNENFQEILRIENEQAKLKEKAIEIKTQETLPNDIKKQLLSDFSAKFNELETDRVDILSGKKTMLKTKELETKPQEISPVEDVVATSVEKKQPTNAKEWEEQNFTKDEIEERRKFGLTPEQEWEPTFRGTSLSEWEDIQKGGDFKSEGLNGLVFTTPSAELAKQSGKGVDAEVIIEFKPESKSKMREGDSKYDSKEYYGDGLNKEDVLRVTDKNGNVIYEATPTTNTPTNGNVQLGASNVGESGITKQQSPAKESVQSPNDVRASEAENEVNLEDIENFINETYLKDEKSSTTTETDQRAIEDSNKENREIPIVGKRKKQVKLTKEGKVSLQGRKSLSKRKFKGDRKTASEIDPTDAQSLALNYFVNGGKISSDYFKSKGERQARNNGINGIASVKAKNIDEIAHDIWESQENHGLKIDTEDIKNAIEEVVNGNLTVQDVVNTILKNYGLEKEDSVDYEKDYFNAIQEYQQEEDYSQEHIQEVESALDYLSDAEIIELANNQEKEFEDYIKDLESRQVTYDLGAFSERGTIQPDGWILSENGELLSPQSVRNVKQVNPYIEVGILSEFGNIGKEGVVTLLKAIKAQLSMESGGVGKPFGVNIWTNEQGEIKYVGNNAKRSKGLIQNTFAFDLNDNLLKEKSIINSKEALKAVEEVISNIPEKLEVKTPISKDTPELKEVNAKLEKANENLRIAKEALDRKAKSLDKELLKDAEDLFGARKSQSENKLFDERVDADARNKATEKERNAIIDAQNEIKSLKEAKAKIENGEIVSTSKMDFESPIEVKKEKVVTKEIKNETETTTENEPTNNKKQAQGNQQNQVKRESADRGDNRGVQEYKGKSVKEQQNKRPGIVVQAESLMPVTKDFTSKNYEIDEVQKQGVNSALTLFQNGGKAFLLADGTGVGKTRQILVTAKEFVNKIGGTVLIISENTTILTKNFAKDAEALGIDMSEFEFGTYNDLRTGKAGKGNYGLVIYDEAHNLKNQESGKAIASNNVKTNHNLYVTATPMDTIGSAVYFITEVSGVSEIEAYSQLGLNVKVQKDPETGQQIKIVTLKEGVAPADIKRNIVKIREQIIANGAMLRREYPFYGEFVEDKISMTESQSEEHNDIESSWDDRIEYESVNDNGTVNIRKKMNLSGQKSGELSRWSESTKIKYTLSEVEKEIKAGNKVVVIAEGVNETTITAIDKVVPGFLSEISKLLKAKGYKVAEIYGKSDKGKANDQFQSNEVDVVLGTAKSASTGIDLDDQNGDNPRVLFMVTPNYSGNVFQQILGRVSRRNTKSPATVRLLYNDSNIDARRKQIVNGKLQTLKAIQEGVIDDDIEIDTQIATQNQEPINVSNFSLEDISEKAFVIKGDTRPIKDDIKSIGGRYNPKYGGWIFPKTKKAEVQELLNKLGQENKPTAKEIAFAEVDKIAQKIKDILPGINDPDLNKQGISQDDLIDLVASAVKTLVSKGIDINDAIRQVISSIKERFNVDVDENLVKEKLGVEKPQDFESKAGKKSVLNRMASGNSSVIKKAIAKYSLDYEIENQKEAKSKAEMFVDEVGVDNALIAVRKGLIDGAQGAFIYARAIEVLEQQINDLKGDDKLDAIADYQELLGQISDELDNRSRSNGRFIAALAEIYNSSNGRYNLTKMVNDYKAVNNGTISKEVLEKLKNVEEKLKESEAKLAELEAKKRIEEENEAFNNILESVARKKRINTNAKISDKQKAKAFADKLRSFKISNNANLSAATPFSIAYDLAIETAAKAIEVSGLVSDAIKAGVNSIRNSKLSKDEQEQALSDLFDLFDDSDVNTGQKGMMSIDQEGKLRIPHSLIREKVENGVDNIDDLVSELMSDAQELFPDLDFTERQIRDIVTGYGKVSNPTTDEIETQISIMKSLGKIASGLEDAYKGQRPLRSGQQRREPTVKERTEMKKLKALLRDLPLADADIKKAYKTALEAIKKRLSNEIEELDEQIANGEKRKGQKSVIEYDQEAKDLKAERDAKKALLDEMVGKPELTEQQKIDRAEKTLQKRLDDLQQKIDNSEIDYAKKAESVTSAKLEEMRKLKKELESQIQKMREDSGLAEARLIDIAKRNASKRLAALKERIANGDFEKRKRKPTPTDVELNKIKSEIAQQKEIFDKEVYKLELKNRRIEQKALDVLKDILSIPKILSFTADLSFVGIQNVTQVYKMGANSLIHLAKTGKLKGTFRDAMAKTFKAMASPDFEQKFMQAVKANPNYQLWKDSRLGIVESHYKESAKAEVFQHNALSTLFDILGNYVASKGYEKAGDIIKNYVNIISIFERGQTVFENQMRINRFQEGVDLLKAQGLNPIDDIQEYRKVAAAVNTLTGRANTGSKVASALREANGTLFSSFSNWAAGVNQLNPYWYYTLTPTARKMALTDVAHHVIGAGSLISLAALYALGQDDDDEDKVTIETDPTSSDFAVIKVGNMRIDPWAGKKTTVVAFSRLLNGGKTDKYGNFKKYGIEYEDEDWIDLPLEYAGNKIAPGPRFAIDRFFKTKKVEYKGQTFREDKYGVDFKESKYLIPLIFENFREVNEEQPNLFGKATMALSWTGLINTNVYGGMKEGFKDMPDDLIEKEYKVKIQKIKDNEKILESNIDKLAKEYNEKKITKNQILQKVDSLVNGDGELFNKSIKSIIEKVNKEELKTLVDDPFYLGLKKEKNPEIQAVLFYSKFKDDSGMSYKEKKERDRNLRYIEFDATNPRFIKAYRELLNSKKKPIN